MFTFQASKLTSFRASSTTTDEIDDVVWALAREAGTEPSSVARSLIGAFLPDFSDRSSSGQVVRPQWLNQTDGGPFEKASVDWGILLTAAQHERADRFVRGRIGHLIWAHNPSKSNLPVADGAIAALLQLAGDKTVDDLARISFAGEAAWLAKTLQRGDSTQEARQQLLALADGAIHSASTTESRPGVLIRAIEYFLAFQGDNSEASNRLKLGISAYSNFGLVRTDLATMLIAVSDLAERPVVAEAEIDRILHDASQQDTFRREHSARQALVMARKFGLNDAQGRAAAVLGAIKPEDYDFKTTEFSITIPPEEIAKFKKVLSDLSEKDVTSAWTFWSELFPRLEPHKDRPEPIMGVMESLVTHTTISEQGHVVDSTSSAEQRALRKHYEDDRQHYEYLYQFVIGPGLHILLERSGGREALESLVADSMLVSDKGKARILKAFASFEDSDWDSVADTMPTIEAAVRQLALISGVSPYSPSGDANQFKTLGGLIGDVTPHLPDSRDGRFWAFALTDGFGYNLRNEYLHGVKEEPTQFDATLVLQIFVQLLRFAYGVEPDDK